MPHRGLLPRHDEHWADFLCRLIYQGLQSVNFANESSFLESRKRHKQDAVKVYASVCRQLSMRSLNGQTGRVMTALDRLVIAIASIRS